jgi:hypothetical protein
MRILGKDIRDPQQRKEAAPVSFAQQGLAGFHRLTRLRLVKLSHPATMRGMSPRKKPKPKPKKSKGVKVSVPASTSGGAPQPAMPKPAPEVPVANPPVTPPLETVVMSQELYDKERLLHLDLIKANTDQHDKAILQLTGATLALSVTFVEKIARNPHPDTLILLGLGWAALATSMIVMLASFQTGQTACELGLARLNKRFESGEPQSEFNLWSILTTWFNRASYILFIVGVILILLFSWVNIPTVDASKGSRMSKSSQIPRPTTPAEPHPGTGHPAPSPPARPTTPPPIKK